ncbi:MAG: hypothetical protein QMC96_05605 [Methanomicrobiales archaeon]|nr:hypothetical protein [Methanomicrobiales archaeon]
MRPHRIAFGIAAALCVAVFLAGPVSAVFEERSSSVRGPVDGGRMTGLLDRLEEKGYDVSAVRAAIENGDNETARALLREFLGTNELPMPPERDHSRMHASRLLERLEEQGFDVSAIRAAVESGDRETARTLLQQFLEEHKDALPGPSRQGDRTSNMTVLLDRLEERGLDVSEIRSAVEGGDAETARTLLQQVMEERQVKPPERLQNGCRDPIGNQSMKRIGERHVRVGDPQRPR